MHFWLFVLQLNCISRDAVSPYGNSPLPVFLVLRYRLLSSIYVIKLMLSNHYQCIFFNILFPFNICYQIVMELVSFFIRQLTHTNNIFFVVLQRRCAVLSILCLCLNQSTLSLVFNSSIYAFRLRQLPTYFTLREYNILKFVVKIELIIHLYFSGIHCFAFNLTDIEKYVSEAFIKCLMIRKKLYSFYMLQR